MSVFTKMTEQELEDLDKEFDSLSSPACHYEIQPEVQGMTSSSSSSLNFSLRSPDLALWSPRPRQVHLGPDPGQGSRLCLL